MKSLGTANGFCEWNGDNVVLAGKWTGKLNLRTGTGWRAFSKMFSAPLVHMISWKISIIIRTGPVISPIKKIGETRYWYASFSSRWKFATNFASDCKCARSGPIPKVLPPRKIYRTRDLQLPFFETSLSQIVGHTLQDTPVPSLKTFSPFCRKLLWKCRPTILQRHWHNMSLPNFTTSNWISPPNVATPKNITTKFAGKIHHSNFASGDLVINNTQRRVKTRNFGAPPIWVLVWVVLWHPKGYQNRWFSKWQVLGTCKARNFGAQAVLGPV